MYITIGSSECDVYVYLVKFYEISLSTEDHFGNFVLDAANATEMIDRYTRNDILDQKNEISPVLLAMKNPDCKVHVYTIPRITTSKDDKMLGMLANKIKTLVGNAGVDVKSLRIIGPADANISRINDVYRKVIYIKSKYVSIQ